jgi:hypothetical protein
MDRRLLAVLFPLLGTVFSCGTSAPPPVSQTVGALGGTVEVTPAANPQLSGTKISIPAGALARDATITVSVGDDLAVAGEIAVGPSVRLLPDGLPFYKPAALTLPYSPSSVPPGASLAVDFRSATIRGQVFGAALAVDSASGTVTLNIVHFTDYQVVATAIPDGGTLDGGSSGDGGTPIDGGPGGNDAGPPDGGATDAGFVSCSSDSDCSPLTRCFGGICLGYFDGGVWDAGLPDAGSWDGGVLDGGWYDAGPSDAGWWDGGSPDAGHWDGGALDGGWSDAGPSDAGWWDGGPPDGGWSDAGPSDAGWWDGGPLDGGWSDAGWWDGGPSDGG